MEIKLIDQSNYAEVAEIYRQGIASGFATFESDVPSWDKWDQSHLKFARIAAYSDKIMTGWAALSPVSDRCVYGGVAEVSVYVHKEAQGKGIGKYLLNELVDISETNDIWTLQSGVFKENRASLELHKKCGFRIIGFRERVGQLNGTWYDNVLLERRSSTVGL